MLKVEKSAVHLKVNKRKNRFQNEMIDQSIALKVAEH